MFKAKFGMFLVVASVALLLAACGGSATPAESQSESSETPDADTQSVVPAEETTIKVGAVFFLRPPAPPSGGLYALKYGLGETLFKLGKDFRTEPWLAVGAEQLDENTWEVTLRQGVKFHNGAPMDAAAVKASLDRAISESANVRELLDIDHIEIKDPSTIRIVTNGLSPVLPNLLTAHRTTIVDAAAAEALGDAFTEKPVLTGPFKVESFQREELVVVRNDDYWGPPPSVDRVVAIYIPDGNSRLLALQSGDIDIADDLPPESVSIVENSPELAVRSSGKQTSLVFMLINHKREAWQDVRVRQAISLAMNRAALATVMQGQGEPALVPFPSAFLSCDGAQGHPFDPAQAKELLTAAGYEDRNGDGLVEKDGQNLKMDLLTYRQRAQLPPLTEAIQAMLKTIGIESSIRIAEQPGEALREADWDVGVVWNGMIDIGDPYGTLFSISNPNGYLNFGGYENPQVDELVSQLAPLGDREERLRLACSATQALLDDVAVVPLLHPNFNYGVSRDVFGFDEPHPIAWYQIDSNIGKR